MDLRESRVTQMIQRDDRAKWLSRNNHNIKCFTKAEIGRITSNYGAIIGKGAFGEVYKGVLEDGSTVAVKNFLRNIEAEFAKELKVHSEINHKNVVRLIGYCAEENVLMIVTEYISKGNLGDVLHHDCIPIVLDTRLRIALECSEALCYMHSQMYTRAIHGDIKPANILLDDNLNAKVSDFGISRLVNTDTTLFTENVIGSIGYMDPSFARTGRLTSKSDVYSFGIVLFELITKIKASVRQGEINIVECFTRDLAKGTRRARDWFDDEISNQTNMKVLEGVAKLAGECLSMEVDRRPEMEDVAVRLRALRKSHVQEKQRRPFFSWGRNKPATENNAQSSSAFVVHVPQPLAADQNNMYSSSASGVHVPQPLAASQNNMHSSSASVFHVPQPMAAAQNNRHSSSASGVHVPQPLAAAQNNRHSCRQFSLEEMISATGNFDESHLVAVGDFVTIYYGVIDGGATKVSIKRCRFAENVDEFQAEIATTAKLLHHHLVSLVGYCIEQNERILLYDYIANGTLGRKLHGYTKKPPLTWRQRLDVCIGAARALQYLHECSITHGDLATRTILLDEGWVTKGSRAITLQWHSSMRKGRTSQGFLDPDFFITRKLTNKSDVYSFGVVLLEVLCARAARDATLPIKQEYLVEYALNCKKKGILALIVDPCLEGKIAPRCLNKFVETAEKCVAKHGVDRPSMREVLQNLEVCLAEQKRGLGDETSGYDGSTNRLSTEERRRFLERRLSD